MLKRRALFWLLAFCLMAVPVQAAAGSLAAEQAKGAVVMEAQSGRLLFEKDSDLRLPMASTTKIMTALLTLEQPDLDAVFTVDKKAIQVEGSSMGLREGDLVSLRTLAYGMLLPSGNDAANAAAVRIAGKMEGFADMMNQRAQELGMTGTHFVTPSGLGAAEHYSTARDMALLAREALANEAFAEICAQTTAKVRYGNPPYERWLTNHNKLLKYYPGVDGVKTGFTDQAGRCLVSSAYRDGVRLIVVTLGCPDDWNAHMQLYDRTFPKVHRQQASLPSLEIPVMGAGTVSTQWSGAELTLLEGEQPELIVTAKPFLFAPVRAGQVVGKAVVRTGGTVAAEFDLAAAKDVTLPEPKKAWWETLFHQ